MIGNSGGATRRSKCRRPGLEAVDEEELGHALVGGFMGRRDVENALETAPDARKIFREACLFDVVHPLRALIRELSARLLRTLARLTPLRFDTLLRFTAHNWRLYVPASGREDGGISSNRRRTERPPPCCNEITAGATSSSRGCGAASRDHEGQGEVGGNRMPATSALSRVMTRSVRAPPADADES